MPYQIIQNKTLPADAPAGGAALLELSGSTLRLKAAAADHLYVETMQDGKNVRINSRNVTQAVGDHTAVQIKPSKTADGTGAVTGLEVSPRFQAGIGGSNLRAILADPVLKAGAGDLTGSVVAFEANLDFGVSGTRTITGDISAFSSFLAIPSTYTYSGDIAFLRVRDVNIKGWDYFLNIDSTGTGLTTDSDKDANSASHTLKVLVGSTLFHIQLYADS
ncbi:hypothetical protein LCGC14_2053430 [marine sediment metagenome]|uniref:Major tropism determinant N-terminal domain-containing protein n=1 Tax=marine sediment metagenome TaxID=412755 RepID=A0A0F9H1R2_9ZZZZ